MEAFFGCDGVLFVLGWLILWRGGIVVVVVQEVGGFVSLEGGCGGCRTFGWRRSGIVVVAVVVVIVVAQT